MLDHIMNAGGAVNPCVNAPSITSIAVNTNEMLACLSNGWHLEWRLTVVGSLGPGQEYYWEQATNAAGDNWAAWGTSSGVDKDKYNPDMGSDGAGGNITRYHRVRAYVVPIGETPPNECNGPTTYGSVVSRTENSCFA